MGRVPATAKLEHEDFPSLLFHWQQSCRQPVPLLLSPAPHSPAHAEACCWALAGGLKKLFEGLETW